MERYINAGKLIKAIEENKRNTEHHKDGRGKQIHVGEHRHFLKMVHEQPTADVVPKSEVERLQTDVEVWKQNRFNIFQRLELYEMTRQKVAREIFEEIEKYECHNLFGEPKMYMLYDAQYAELKKKYTEGET